MGGWGLFSSPADRAQIEYLDEQLGNLTRLYKSFGMWDDTLMVLHSDNVRPTRCAMPCRAQPPGRADGSPCVAIASAPGRLHEGAGPMLGKESGDGGDVHDRRSRRVEPPAAGGKVLVL